MRKHLSPVLFVLVFGGSASAQESAIPTSGPSETSRPAQLQTESEEQAHTRIRQMMKAADDRLADRSWVVPHVERIYRPIVVGFPLSPAQQAELLRLLSKRCLAVVNERQSFLRKAQEARRADPQHKGSRYGDLDVAEARAAAEAEGEMQALVDPDTWFKVKEMIAAEFELSRVESSYAKSFEEDGHPLSAEQHFCLASALHWQTLRRGEWILEQGTDKEPLKPLGLTTADEESLARMEGTLSPEQIEEVRRGFVLTQRRIRGIPVEWEHLCDIPANAAELIAEAEGVRFGHHDVELRGTGKAKLKGRRTSDPREYCGILFERLPKGLCAFEPGVALFYEGRLVEIASLSQISWTIKPRAKL